LQRSRPRAGTLNWRNKLPQVHRQAKATAAANKYAPRPEGSAFTYGSIAVVLAVLGIVIFGMFYDVEVLANPLLIGAGLVLVFMFGVLLRFRRRRLHGQAFEEELERHDNSPPIR
jgi:protein-S-isoprenylcysteine O-methyltransferase Ste14